MFNGSFAGRIVNRVINNHQRRKSEQNQSKELGESAKPLQKKSSRDLLSRIDNIPDEKPLKNLFSQSKHPQAPILTHRENLIRDKMAKKQPCRTHIPTSNSGLKNTIKTQNSLCKEQSFCQNTKPTPKKQKQDSNEVSVPDQLVKWFRDMLSRESKKFVDPVGKTKFEQIIVDLTGVGYIDVAGPIWGEVLEGRDVNYLTVLNLLLALFSDSIHSYNISDQRPSSMYRDQEEETSMEKRKILIRKSTSKPKPASQLGTFSSESSCLVFSLKQKQQISSKFNHLKHQIQNKLTSPNPKHPSKPAALLPSPPQQITLKIHLNNSLTSLKITQLQHPTSIASRFARQQKLDSALQKKLCFFLTKQFSKLR